MTVTRGDPADTYNRAPSACAAGAVFAYFPVRTGRLSPVRLFISARRNVSAVTNVPGPRIPSCTLLFSSLSVRQDRESFNSNENDPKSLFRHGYESLRGD